MKNRGKAHSIPCGSHSSSQDTTIPRKQQIRRYLRLGKGDDRVKNLVQGSKSDGMKGIAKQRLNSLINTWVEERRDVVTVSELLELHLTNGKLYESSLSS